ncbi:hypothetical protein D9M68_933840 [compost metagenome]
MCERRYIFNASGGGALNPMGTCPAVTLTADHAAKVQADEVAFAAAVESEAQKAARVAAETERAAREAAAAKERGTAISGFIGGLFGGGGDANVAPVVSGKPAPTPHPTLQR